MDGGKVYLVGAGPGDAGLMTLRGRRLLAEADAIVIDRLAPARLLRYAREDAEVYHVGKAAGRHLVPQREVEALLIRLARRGLTVVRLKGGDPFVFGRGGEEIVALSRAGVPWEVVPGITSAVAVPAYAGIPLTYRGVSSAFTVVTGHRCTCEEAQNPPVAAGEAPAPIDWSRLAKADGTLVILMGVTRLSEITERLIAFGRSPDAPAAVIQWGTRATQRTVRARLGELAERARAAGIGSPAVIVVGALCALSEALAWYERLPLFGRRVVAVAETRERALAMAEAAEALGAEAVDLSLLPYARFDRSAVDRLLKGSGLGASAPGRGEAGRRALWVFRTALGVEAVWRALEARGLDARALSGIRIAAAGPGAEAALLRRGIRPDALLPEQEEDAPFDGRALFDRRARRFWAAMAEPGAPVFVEAGGGLAAFGQKAPERGMEGASCGSSFERLSLWTVDGAGLRARLERLLSDAVPPRIDLLWAESPAALAVGKAALDIASNAQAAPFVVIGGRAEDLPPSLEAGAPLSGAPTAERAGAGEPVEVPRRWR